MTPGDLVRSRTTRLGLVLAAVVLGAPAAWAVAPTGAPAVTAPCPADRPLTEVQVGTVPVVPGARLEIAGTAVVTDAAGRATVSVCKLTSARDITGPRSPISLPGQRRAVFDRVFLSGRSRVVQASFGMENEVSFSFQGLPTREIESFTLRSSTGQVITRTDLGPVYLPGSRVLRGPDGLEQRDIYYSVDAVTVAGSSVVNRSQVRFYPSERTVVRVPLLAFDVKVQVVDRLFGNPVGSAVSLTRSGSPDVHRTLEHGVATFTEVPRGDYSVVAEAPGLRIDRRLVLSSNQAVVMPVLTWLDLVVLLGLPLVVAVGLVLAPRPALRRRLSGLTGLPQALWLPPLSTPGDRR
ncbi:hypothetical protein [Oryzobacter telluris]|uniref:hypothetical protein n=1 Tax=Oryzobacter telluris TaxID=3149179 RepID=UPI00370D6F58